MDLGLTGKRALVTGASKGIGLAITSALVAEGAHVVAGSRSVSDGLRELIGGGPGAAGERRPIDRATARRSSLRRRSRTVRSTCSSTTSAP